MLGTFCKNHLTIKQFYPVYEDPRVFIRSQWQRDKDHASLIYLTYRILIALLFITTWMASIIRERKVGLWPIFLTNWGYTICTIQSLIAVVMLSGFVFSSRVKNMHNLGEKVLKLYPVYWVLHTIATPLAFGITFMYWIVIYDATKMTLDAMNYFVHGNNSILMMIDLWMISHPIRVLHFIYPAICGIMYTIFSIIYYISGGISKDGTKCIYKILDWDKPLTTALTCVGVTVFLICLHLITFLIFKVKVALHEKYRKKQGTPVAETKKQASYLNEGMSNDIV